MDPKEREKEAQLRSTSIPQKGKRCVPQVPSINSKDRKKMDSTQGEKKWVIGTSDGP